MDFKYADEQNALMIAALLKAHGIRRVVTSPGSTNTCLNVCLQHDGSFEMYSCIDERSAAYIACGLAAETGEPVVICCTEATASRDYLPGLTEAYHRKLPILAITGMHGYAMIGHLEPQVIDRSVSPVDCFRLKVNLPVLKDEADIWESQLKINQAILELKRRGGGPVHINMPLPKTFYEFNVPELPKVRVLRRYTLSDPLPALPEGKKAIFVGSHIVWSEALTQAVDSFCAAHDAVVLCDHSSKYYGSYGAHMFLPSVQKYQWDVFDDLRLVIHMGEEAADQPTMIRLRTAGEVWRVSPDGELRDTFHKLSNVFEMNEVDFFTHYCPSQISARRHSYVDRCREICAMTRASIPPLPFSNLYAAQKIAPNLPENAFLHLGASNTIRAWSAFDLPQTVRADSNMGCRGIDGAVSASVGVSLAHPDCPCYCVVGDLTFFYDMGVLGNRHIGNNFRLLVVNNGGGNIFKLNGAMGHYIGDENANLYLAAAGHYGGQNSQVIRSYATALGFRYLSASSIQEFEAACPEFLSPEITQPMVFELITQDADEREAFRLVNTAIADKRGALANQAKKLLGDKGTHLVKTILGK